jgi:hypothetical protein
MGRFMPENLPPRGRLILGRGVLVDLAGLAVQHPDEVVTFVGSVKLLVLRHVKIVDEGQGVADQPLFNLGTREFRARAVVVRRLDRLAIETLGQHARDGLDLAGRQHRQHAFHLVDGLYPVFMAAGNAGCRIAHLVAIVALADEWRPVVQALPRQLRVMGRRCQGIG